MARALPHILRILASHCWEDSYCWVLGSRVWLVPWPWRNSNKSITAWSITLDIKYTTHYLRHSHTENSSKQNFLHHLYLGWSSDFSKVAQILVQGHIAAVVGVTRHRFSSFLGLVGTPTEVKGLSFVGVVMLAVKALVSANITCFILFLRTSL